MTRPDTKAPLQEEILRLAFVHELHLGHRTFAENVKSAAPQHVDIDVSWVPVPYETEPRASQWLPRSLRSALAGRREVRVGLRRAAAEVHLFNTQVPAALGGGRARAKPYIVVTDVTPLQFDRIATGYGHHADGSGLISRWKHHVNRRVFADARWCVGWSTWVAESFAHDYDVDRTRIAVIPPGIDTDLWRPSDRVPDGVTRILFVGGDFVRKGGDTLLESLKSLPSNVELNLVTKARVEASDRVRVFGDLVPNAPGLVELFGRCDVFAMPSRAETFGIAAAEASSVGLPVVASDVGGLSDIVSHGSTGIVVPPGDVGALTAALRHLVEDVDLRRRMGAAGRARAVERFSARDNAARLFDLVRSCRTPVDGSAP